MSSLRTYGIQRCQSTNAPGPSKPQMLTEDTRKNRALHKVGSYP